MRGAEMKVKDAVNECLKERKMSKSALAKKMGFPLPSYIINLVARGEGMAVGKLLGMLETLGYEVVIRDKISGAEIGALEMDGEEEEK
jgi:hypothetical protein